MILAVLYIRMQHHIEITVQIPGQQGMTVCLKMKWKGGLGKQPT